MTQAPERPTLTTDPALEAELDHRMSRYGLNPCVTGDTWAHTEWGARQVWELVGRQHGTHVNGELFSTTTAGFFSNGIQPIYQLQTQAGYTLRLTGNHQLLKVTSQTQKSQYSEWIPAEQLQPGDKILLHNHRHIQPWSGEGTWAEGWLLGNLVGDGCLAVYQPSHHCQGKLRYWGEHQSVMAEFALATCQQAFPNFSSHEFYHQRNRYIEISTARLYHLAAGYGLQPKSKTITPAIERSSYEFYQGFLQGFFDADGSVQGSQIKGVSIRLAQSNLERLQAVQRMLLRLGIVSTLYQNRRLAHTRLMPNSDRQLAEYTCQPQHELVISNDNLWEFQRVIGFQEPEKRERLHTLLNSYQRNLNRERFTATVTALIPDGEEPVYDCTVPGVARFDANGFVAHNCGEIIGADFHCVAGNTLLITRNGLAPIQSLVGQTVEIWNGQRWSRVVPQRTGRGRQLYRVQFGDGTWLDVTGKHRFFVRHRFGKNYTEMTTQEVENYLERGGYALHTEPFHIDYQEGECVDPIWAYTLGQLVGDGSLCQSHDRPQLQLRLYGDKSYRSLTIAGRSSGRVAYYTENRKTPCLLYTGFGETYNPEYVRQLKANPVALEPLAQWHREAILHFIAGWIDADGSGTASGGVRLYLSQYDRAYRVYLLLLKCGIRSSINLAAKAGETTNLGVRRQDLWYLQITDCQAIPCQRVDTSKGHPPQTKGKWQVIQAVTPLPGEHDTYCFNEPEVHKGVFGGTLTGQCNLAEIHLNQIDPHNFEEQEKAFTAGALSVAALLNHQFVEPRFQYSRELDPIVGVSFTGLFDFFVHAFGKEWLHWWAADRPKSELGLVLRQKETDYLQFWRDVVHRVVWSYCDRHGLRRPNRCTTVQPAGTKSLLTNASPGWHPPKAQRYIRRITFAKNDPVALACMDYGYAVVPGQSDKDDQGNLLHDPFDPRCNEWLVEIPVAVSWADIADEAGIDISRFNALAQFDFYMNVQRNYTTHNTSATIEFREYEIETLADRIYQAIQRDEGYISAALLSRFDALQTFPRLPFEPINKEQYEQLMQGVVARRKLDDFGALLRQYDQPDLQLVPQASACEGVTCELPSQPQG